MGFISSCFLFAFPFQGDSTHVLELIISLPNIFLLNAKHPILSYLSGKEKSYLYKKLKSLTCQRRTNSLKRAPQDSHILFYQDKRLSVGKHMCRRRVSDFSNTSHHIRLVVRIYQLGKQVWWLLYGKIITSFSKLNFSA